jgi:hypothetical protein
MDGFILRHSLKKGIPILGFLLEMADTLGNIG